MAAPPVVEVRDTNDRPVEGAEVVFRLPAEGPSGIFPDGKLTKTVRTNLQGQAQATGLEPNNQPGRFEILVTATIGNQVGSAAIPQRNVASLTAAEISQPRRRWGWWKWAAIGGGAAVVVVLLTRGDSTPTVIVTPGPVVIGGR
jgi:hypothetical protein